MNLKVRWEMLREDLRKHLTVGGVTALVVTVLAAMVLPTWVESRNLHWVFGLVAADLTTFPFMGEEIQCDQGGRSQIDGVSSYISLFGTLHPDFPGVWKAKSNNYVPIPDVETFKLMVQAMVTQGTINFMKSESLKAYVRDPSRTVEEIRATSW